MIWICCRSKSLTTLDEWYESIIYEGVILFHFPQWALFDKEANDMNLFAKYLIWLSSWMLCFDIQLVCSIGSLFGRGVVCMILATYIADPNLLPALDVWYEFIIYARSYLFFHWVFIYEVYEVRREERKSSMIWSGLTRMFGSIQVDTLRKYLWYVS